MKEEEGQRWLIPAVMGYDPGSNSVCARGKRRGWDLALVSPWNGCHACRSFPCKSCSLDGCALVDRWPASSPLPFSFFFLLAWRKGRNKICWKRKKRNTFEATSKVGIFIVERPWQIKDHFWSELLDGPLLVDIVSFLRWTGLRSKIED